MLLGRIRVEEPPATGKRPVTHLLRDIREGVAFTYRHRTLGPLAWSTHVWFVANAIALTVFAPFALRALDMGALGYGVSLALAGVGGLAGASLATGVGNRYGAGHAVLSGRMPIPVAWAVIAVAPGASAAGSLASVSVIAAAQLVYGFSMRIPTRWATGRRSRLTRCRDE